MKTGTLRYILPFLGLLMAGCVKETLIGPEATEATEAIAEDGSGMTFIILRETDAITRAALSGEGVIAFQPGDRISVFDGMNRNCPFTQTGEIGTDGSASFTGRIGAVSESYLALYPYMSDVESDGDRVGTSGSDDTRHPVFVPREQKAVSGSFDPEAFISVGSSERKSNSVHTITFKNSCALIKFTIPESVGNFIFEKAVLKAGSGLLAGGVGIHPDGTRDWLGPGSDSLVLKGTMRAGDSYYFCSVVHDGSKQDNKPITGLTLKLYNSVSDTTPVFVKSTDADREIKLERNKILDLGTLDITSLPEKNNDWYGSGTTGDPYQLSNEDDLALLIGRLANGADPSYRGLCYRLTDDIDCHGDSLTTSGGRVEFCGVLDGNGHTISNYRTTCYEESYYPGQEIPRYVYRGLFHRVYRATFKDLSLRPADMKSGFKNSNYVSPFIALADGADGRATLFENCHLEGEMNLEFSIYEWGKIQFGGFVGGNHSNDLDFHNCTNDAAFTFSSIPLSDLDEEYVLWNNITSSVEPNTTYYIGGFVGFTYSYNENSTLDFDRCRNKGSISFTLDIPGSIVICSGFLGYGDYGYVYANTYSFTNCVNSGAICTDLEGNSAVYASGFVGFSNIDGNDHDNVGTAYSLAKPRFYNCLNKGSVIAHGNDAHASGFAFYRHKDNTDDDSNQFALCINIGAIEADANDLEAPIRAAIAAGHGTCRWCWWLEEDKNHPVLPCTIDGTAHNCYCYPTINADTPNNRRTGSDGNGGQEIVLDNTNTQWTHKQWLDNTVPWTGGSADFSLDLDF